MTDTFEQWAPREIRRLREEAAVLQLALDRFVGAQGGRKPRATTNPNPTPNLDGQSRRSKHEALFGKWAEASKVQPLSYNDMDRIARDEGAAFNRSLLRSTVHAQKKIGRVKLVGDCYVWQPEQTEATPPVEENVAL